MWWVAFGGVVGSLSRYLLNELFGSDDTGVLAANLIGVAIAALAIEYCKLNQRSEVRNFLLPGFCGGLTTFSSLMLISDEVGFSYLFETIALSFLVIAFVTPITRNFYQRKL